MGGLDFWLALWLNKICNSELFVLPEVLGWGWGWGGGLDFDFLLVLDWTKYEYKPMTFLFHHRSWSYSFCLRCAEDYCHYGKWCSSTIDKPVGHDLLFFFFWGGGGGGEGRGGNTNRWGAWLTWEGGKEGSTWWWKQTTVLIMKVNMICNMYQKYIALYMNN